MEVIEIHISHRHTHLVSAEPHSGHHTVGGHQGDVIKGVEVELLVPATGRLTWQERLDFKILKVHHIRLHLIETGGNQISLTIPTEIFDEDPGRQTGIGIGSQSGGPESLSTKKRSAIKQFDDAGLSTSPCSEGNVLNKISTKVSCLSTLPGLTGIWKR